MAKDATEKAKDAFKINKNRRGRNSDIELPSRGKRSKSLANKKYKNVRGNETEDR